MKKKKNKQIKVRRLWKLKPITKLKESIKLYKRNREKKKVKIQIKEESF